MSTMIHFMTPITTLFVVIVVGYILGKIRIGSISLDVAGVLLTAILFGVLACRFFPSIMDDAFRITMNTYSKLGTTLFMAAIGIGAGSTLRRSSRKAIIYFGIGTVCVWSAFLCFLVLARLDSTMDDSMLIGILCGALTSSPGLASAIERTDVIRENAVIGYGSTYLFGAVFVVLFAQFLAVLWSKHEDSAVEKNSARLGKNRYEGLVLIGLCGLLGGGVGNISFWGYSLGTSGGVLTVGIIIGWYIDCRNYLSNIVASELQVYRNWGLTLFFVGNGVLAGYQLKEGIHARAFLYGLIITTVSLLLTALLCRFCLKDNSARLGTIAGSMTSTPALGALVKRDSSVDMSAYSFSYLAALLTTTLGISFIRL